MNLSGKAFQALRAAPQSALVTRFDKAVDGWVQAHLRGRPALDRLMYSASAGGEHSAIWLALAGLEGLRSGRPGRALFRAGAALGAESALVNGAVKAVFKRERPGPGPPRPHHLRQPVTSSFPSGHASAAFFAAALLRDSPFWPFYYLTAGVVAASRVHVSIHHASDVVAGAALGALMGEVARQALPGLVVPPRPR